MRQINSKGSSPGPAAGSDSADTLFLRGHLAVLFGLLMRGNPDNQEHILQSLSRSNQTLEQLAEQAREFVSLYNALSGGMEEATEERTARDVVVFLEQLRDSSTRF
jgi:hypothetical protein